MASSEMVCAWPLVSLNFSRNELTSIRMSLFRSRSAGILICTIPLLDAQTARLTARLACEKQQSGETAVLADVENLFIAAVDGFRAIDSRYWLAVTLCEYGEWLARVERSAEAEVIIEGARRSSPRWTPSRGLLAPADSGRRWCRQRAERSNLRDVFVAVVLCFPASAATSNASAESCLRATPVARRQLVSSDGCGLPIVTRPVS